MVNKILAGVDEVGRGCLAGPVISCAIILKKNINKKFIKDSKTISFKNRIKIELAGSIWGKNENTNIRLLFDNQILEALKYFNEADAFINTFN